MVLSNNKENHANHTVSSYILENKQQYCLSFVNNFFKI